MYISLSTILISIITFIIGLLFKNYLPKYIEEKAKNLATKEDLKEITEITENTLKPYKEDFEKFRNDLSFKYDYNYNKYAELYAELYSIIIQSEYARTILPNKIPFEEEPFITFAPIKREKTTFTMGGRVTKTTEEIKTPLSEFNSGLFIEMIIESGKFASQDVIKLAISYRAEKHLNGDDTEKATRLLSDLIKLIVKEYNQIRDELKLNCNKNELKTGIMELNF